MKELVTGYILNGKPTKDETIGGYFSRIKFTAKQCGNEYSKLNSTEHIPMQGPEIDLIFRHLLCRGKQEGYTDFFNINFQFIYIIFYLKIIIERKNILL